MDVRVQSEEGWTGSGFHRFYAWIPMPYLHQLPLPKPADLLQNRNESRGLHRPDTACLLHEPSAQLHEDHCRFHNRWGCLPAQPLHSGCSANCLCHLFTAHSKRDSKSLISLPDSHKPESLRTEPAHSAHFCEHCAEE